MNYTEAVDYIHSLLTFGIKPGLERIKMLLDALGNPQDKLKTVHIAGTNGKGSTSTMIANMLSSEGLKTGLFTSPYVIDFCERIKIDGENIEKNALAKYVTRVREEIEKLNIQGIVITEFEAITAAAFLCFYDSGCDFAVIEVGLGGRFDATNVLSCPEAVVITSISLDHTAILGDTVGQIAYEKCGIIKNGSKVITNANQSPEVLSVIENTVREKGGVLTVTNSQTAEILNDNIFGTEFFYDGEKYKTALTGNHQIENAVNAIETAKALNISSGAVKKGIENTRMLARMEVMGESPLIIRDGGHNEGCAEALRNFLLKYKVKNIKMLVGLMADKDVTGYIKEISPLCKEAVTVTPSNPRALESRELSKIAGKYCKTVTAIDNPKKGYEYIMSSAQKTDTVLICGSFYMMSDIFEE